MTRNYLLTWLAAAAVPFVTALNLHRSDEYGDPRGSSEADYQKMGGRGGDSSQERRFARRLTKEQAASGGVHWENGGTQWGTTATDASTASFGIQRATGDGRGNNSRSNRF